MSRRVRLGWIAAYAVASFLAFPQPWGEGAIDLGLVFGWLAPALLVLALRGIAPRRALGWGFLAGLAAHSMILHWIYVVTVKYGNAPAIVGPIAVVGLASYLALFGALFGAGASWLGRQRAAGPLALALLWTALDHLRSFLFTGFPWATLGYALHLDAPLRALTAWTGVYGLSFAAALGSIGLAAALRSEVSAGRTRRSGVVALAALAALHAVGAAIHWADPPGSGPMVRVGIAQGNISQGDKWSPAWRVRTMEIYEALTREAVAAGAELVVWPESAAPGFPDHEPELRERIAALARETGATLVVGSVGTDEVIEGGERGIRYFDSGYLVAPDGRFLDRYDKSHLVPFGEYVPFRNWIGRWVKAVATGIASSDVTAGARPRAVAVPPAGEAPGFEAGIVVCYELIFPDLVRRFRGDGARVLLGITNDAWYGDTGAPHQFLAMSALRSAETRTPMVRAANTGVSAFVDAAGRVELATPVFERRAVVAEVMLAERERRSFYVRYGDVFATLCWVALAALALRVRLRRGSEAEPARP